VPNSTVVADYEGYSGHPLSFTRHSGTKVMRAISVCNRLTAPGLGALMGRFPDIPGPVSPPSAVPFPHYTRVFTKTNDAMRSWNLSIQALSLPLAHICRHSLPRAAFLENVERRSQPPTRAIDPCLAIFQRA
jgi:hypothetical protein